MKDLEEDLNKVLLLCEPNNVHYLEKLLISLMGYTHIEIRDAAIIFLNVLYDKKYW